MIKMTGGNKIIPKTERRCEGYGELQQAGVTGEVSPVGWVGCNGGRKASRVQPQGGAPPSFFYLFRFVLRRSFFQSGPKIKFVLIPVQNQRIEGIFIALAFCKDFYD